jgi:uncharacterized membrane protein
MLFTHITATLLSIILGYYLFVFSGQPIQTNKPLVYIFGCLLIISAFTGILLNTYSFSPFHILAIVTITTIPLAMYNLFKSQFLQFKRGLFYNFLGLNLAFCGALEPTRYLGRRLWKPLESTFGLSREFSSTAFTILFVLSMILAIYFVIQANRKSNFFL